MIDKPNPEIVNPKDGKNSIVVTGNTYNYYGSF